MKNTSGAASESLQYDQRHHFTTKSWSNLGTQYPKAPCGDRQAAFFNRLGRYQNRLPTVSAKVAALMRSECSSAIFIFTADEQFFQEDEDGNRTEVWRPSENVIYELGAASILNDRRIVIFKEKRVTFPSDYSDLGHITFEAGSLDSQIGDLFSELVALDILEVRAKG